MKGHAHTIRASPRPEVRRMSDGWFLKAGQHLGITMLVLSAIGGVVATIRKVFKWYMARKNALASINDSILEISNQVKALATKVEAMDTARTKARKEDATIRRNLYMGQIAVISAVKELAEHQGLKINGPVQYYYDQNIDALHTGLGMEQITLEDISNGGT